MSIVGYLVKPEPEARKVKDGERAPIICAEYYKDVDDYDPVLRAHCRLSDETGLPWLVCLHSWRLLLSRLRKS